LNGGSGGVTELTTQHNEGFALDDELGDIPLLAECGNRALSKSKLGDRAEQQQETSELFHCLFILVLARKIGEFFLMCVLEASWM